MLYIYLNFIKEDWSDYKEWAIPIIKPLWFMRSVYVWLSSIIFFPIYLFGMLFEEDIKKGFEDGIKRFLIKNI